MSFLTATFYVFSAILIFAALRVVTTRNPVHAALWLVLLWRQRGEWKRVLTATAVAAVAGGAAFRGPGRRGGRGRPRRRPGRAARLMRS